MKFVAFLILILSFTTIHAQQNNPWPAYGNVAEFTSMPDEFEIDTLAGSITIHNWIYSTIAPSFKKVASKEQEQQLLASCEWTAFSALNHYADTAGDTGQIYNYEVVSTCRMEKDTFTLTAQHIQRIDSVTGSSDIIPYIADSNMFVVDSDQFFRLRKQANKFVLSHIPTNHIPVKTLYTDLDGDGVNEIVIASIAPMVGEVFTSIGSPMAYGYLLQVFKETDEGYLKIFETNDMFSNLAIVPFKGQTNKAILIVTNYCYHGCGSDIEIFTWSPDGVVGAKQRFPAGR